MSFMRAVTEITVNGMCELECGHVRLPRDGTTTVGSSLLCHECMDEHAPPSALDRAAELTRDIIDNKKHK